MKVAKIAKTKEKKMEIITEDEFSIKKLAIITIIIILVLALFYFITTLFINKEENSKDDDIVVFDSSKITVGQLLDRKEDEYYVLALRKSLYSSSYSDINYYTIYSNYIKAYNEKEDSLKFYTIDLDDVFNKSFISDTNNITEDLSNLKLKDEVLFKIKDSKIEESYIGNTNIIDALSNL